MNPNAKRTQQAYTCGQAPPPPFTLLSQGQLENFTVRVPRAFNQQPAPPVPLPAAKAATLTVGEPKEDNGNVPVSSIEAPSPKLL